MHQRPQQHRELVYSKQELVEKKDITQFLTNNNIKFDGLGNVYRDYQAYIKINNLQNRSKPKVKPYVPPPQEKPKPQKIKRPQSTSPTKKPKKEKQKKLNPSISKKTAEFHSLAHPVGDSSTPETSAVYISAPTKNFPQLEEAQQNSHEEDYEISETIAQQEQQEDIVDIVVPSVIRELISFVQNKKDDPELNVQDAIKTICLNHIQKYSLNQEQSVRAINRVMQDFSSMMENSRNNPTTNDKKSENWSRTPRLGSMNNHSEDFSSLNDGGAAKRTELNEYLDEFISHNEEEFQSKKRAAPPLQEAGEYVAYSEGEEERRKSNNNLGASKSNKSFSSQGQRINKFAKSKSSFHSENNTGRSKSAKSNSPATPVKNKKPSSRSPQWRYSSPDDYVSIEKKKSRSPKQRSSNSPPARGKALKLKERYVSEIPKGQHWNEKKEFEKRVLAHSSSGLKAPDYHSPIKRELRKKFDDYERLSKLKASQLNNSLGEKLSTTVDGLFRPNRQSPSPITNRSFIYNSKPPEVQQSMLGKKRLNEEWYNEQSKKVFQDRMHNMEKQFSKFLPSKGTATISCDKLGSFDKIKYYKMLLQRSKLQSVENYRKIPPTVPK